MYNTAESDKRIYMDYAATTPTDPEILQKMLPYFDSKYGNPSSMHRSGRLAGQAIRKARFEVAKILNCLPGEIIFTGSGTESDNLAILGVARANRAYGNHIIISSIEHKAVLEPARELEKEGFRVSLLPVAKDGRIDVKECIKLVDDSTILISVMYANNEIGTIQPIKELSGAIRKIRRNGGLPLIHTDACQATGFLSLDVEDSGVDLMTVNGSKIYGPKAVGILYKRTSMKIEPIIWGGEQEMHLRAGTESVPLIVGFSEALKKVDNAREKESERLTALRDYFIERLLNEIPGACLNGHHQIRLPNNVHISIPDIEGESILLMLDKFGIEASTGSACSTYDLKPSHVLLAIGQDTNLCHGSLRFSLGKYSTREEIDSVMNVLTGVVKRLRKLSALTVKI